MARPPLLQWPIAAALAAALTAGGCAGLSIPLGELTSDAPAITGSSSTAWPLPTALPASLSAADATAISQAARHAIAGDGGEVPGDWTNAATGSSGSLVALGAARADGTAICRTYASTVNSIRGVHRFICEICRTADGQVAIRSIEADGAERVATAGI